jgi:hypothetical protein
MNMEIEYPTNQSEFSNTFKRSAAQQKRLTSIDVFFSWGLYITLGTSCISNLRITPNGIELMPKSGGYPFLYEIGVAVVLISALLRFIHGFPLPSKRQKQFLSALTLFYVPIFLNFIFLGFDRSQLIGGGQLRLQLEIWFLGTALILYPIKKHTIQLAIFVVVVMSLANCLYIIAISQGILQPLYERAYRIPGDIRHSGFTEMPAHSGVLSAIAISWALWLVPKKAFRVSIGFICGFALFISDSRTGMVAVVITLAAKLLSTLKIPKLLFLSLTFLCLATVVSITFYIPGSLWEDSRPLSILASMHIWLNNPLGVPWGTFEQFNPYFQRAVSPHNWPAIALLYGGILSLIAVVIAHTWLIRLWLFNRNPQSTDDRFYAVLVLILISITVSSWFEQIFQTAFAAFVYVAAAAFLAHRPILQSARGRKLVRLN